METTIEQTPALRYSGIGGSDAAAICGLSRWRTPVQIYLNKIGESCIIEETEAMHFGHVLEQVVADEFTRLTGLKVRRYSTNETLRHPDYPHIMGHIDRKIEGQEIGLECKTAGRWYSAEEWGETGTDLVPADYLLQCQHYMLVTGWQKWHLAVLLAGNTFRHYEINRDEDIIASLLKKENTFWKLVQDRIPPPPTDTLDTRLLYPKDKGESVIVNGDIDDDIVELQLLMRKIKSSDDRAEQLKTRIQSYMENAARLIGFDGTELCTWRTQSASRFDQKSFEEEHVDLFKEYKRSSEYRVFRILRKENKK